MSADGKDAVLAGNWLVGTNAQGNPTDLRPTLVAGQASNRSRNSQGMSDSPKAYDLQRVSVLRVMVDALLEGSFTENTKSIYAEALKRFVKWVDSNGAPLSRDTIVTLLDRFEDRRSGPLRSAFAPALGLSVSERHVWFPWERVEGDDARWLVGINGNGFPTDMRPALYAGMAKTHPRQFSSIDRGTLQVDQARIDVIKQLVDTLDELPYEAATKSNYAESLKLFLFSADASKRAVSRSSVVSILSNYSGRGHENLRNLFGMALVLTEEERQQLFPKEEQVQQELDEWVLSLESHSHSYKFDAARLLYPGDATMSVREFASKREQRIRWAISDDSGRARLVTLLRDEFAAAQTARTYSDRSLHGVAVSLRTFMVWADDSNVALNRDTVVSALTKYSQHLTQKWRAGANPSTTRKYVDRIVPLLASALDVESFEIRALLNLPPESKAGLTSKRPEPEARREFCGFLHAIVQALPTATLCGPIREPITVSIGDKVIPLPSPIGGHSEPRFDPRLANLFLIRLRIWAELHRFIGLTGANLAVVQEITVDQWIAEGFSLRALKARANKLMSPKSTDAYARHLDSHVGFLTKAIPAEVGGQTPLFPTLISEGPKRTFLVQARSGALPPPELKPMTPARENVILKWAEDFNVPRLGTVALRKVKADWLLRRYKGDALKVSQALGNTPRVVHVHYGGKGNLAAAMTEWGEFWKSDAKLMSRAPGLCGSPGKFVPLSEEPQSECNEGACLGCAKYRGEDTIDYIHRILSYQYVLCWRATGNDEIPPLIERIDGIVDSFVARHPESSAEVEEMRKGIAEYPHPRFEASIRLIAALYA